MAPTAPDAFPTDCLPEVVANQIRESARIQRVPESLPGVCVLGIVSAATGSKLKVKSGPERNTRGNLYLIVGARSGSGKSEVMRKNVRVLHDYEARMIAEWGTRVANQANARKRVLEAQLKQLEKQAEKPLAAPEQAANLHAIEMVLNDLDAVKASLVPPRICVEDITIEKLAVALMQNGEVLASLSADGGCIVDLLLGKYNHLKRTDDGLYLKAYSGDAVRVDRIGRPPVVLNSPCLIALWLVQPDKIDTLFAVQALHDGGLLPRVMPCLIDLQLQPITEVSQAVNPAVTTAWESLIVSLLDTFYRSKNELIITPHEAATVALYTHDNVLRGQRDGMYADVDSFAARWNEWAWRLSVVLHAAKHGKTAAHELLTLETAQAAIRLTDWFVQQQLTILTRSREAAKEKQRSEVLALLASYPDGITATDVTRKRIVPNAAQGHFILKEIADAGFLEAHTEQPAHGGHQTIRYTIKHQ